jgi:predicted phage-related endonuclease
MNEAQAVENAENIIALPDEAYEVINDYNLACTAEKEAKKAKDQAKFKLLEYMGTSQIGIYDTIKVSHTEQKKETLDAKAIKIDHPEIYEKYVTRTVFGVMRVSQIK